MSHQDKPDFSKKHSADKKPNPLIENEISTRSKDNQIACAVAFDIAKALNVDAGEVGMTIDLMNYQLIKCQLGLFGYQPQKKIVNPTNNVDQELTHAVKDELNDGKLSCEKAWGIASRLNIRKMNVSQACESMKIKIKPCQLGAF